MPPTVHSVSMRIRCAAGALEGRLAHAGGASPAAGVLVHPPHPLLAGNIDNNVVRAVVRAAAERGFGVLTFNYRAIGASWHPQPHLPAYEYWSALDREGTYGEIRADMEFMEAEAARWFVRVHLVGYSFGAAMLLRPRVAVPATPSWCAIAPPNESGMVALPGCGLIVRPGSDGLLHPGATPFEAPHAAVCTVAGADHFFRGHEDEVAAIVANHLVSADRRAVECPVHVGVPREAS